MNIKIKEAKLSDLKRISYITKLAYKKPFTLGGIITKVHIDESLESNFKNKTVGILVATFDDKVVGAVKYKYKDKNNLYLFQLVTLKTYRGYGIGKMLIKGVEDICVKNNIKKLSLDCMVEKELPSYYEKYGFKVKKIEEKNGKHIACMERRVLV